MISSLGILARLSRVVMNALDRIKSEICVSLLVTGREGNHRGKIVHLARIQLFYVVKI